MSFIVERRVRLANVGTGDLPDNKLRVQVELEWGGETYVGMAEEVWRENAEFVCAANAACRALDAVVAPTHTRFEALQSEAVSAVGRMLAVVAVAIHSQGENQYTVGVCAIAGDPAGASVRAVLSATNRRMTRLLSALAGS
ncbi:MAG: hypothetical protein JSW71_23175 [Gemmatimonadota bacterium]|nr:MAG: hypothetical protein JSW71_23175 [Gemmatimonadota bacterium]